MSKQGKRKKNPPRVPPQARRKDRVRAAPRTDAEPIKPVEPIAAAFQSVQSGGVRFLSALHSLRQSIAVAENVAGENEE